MPSRIHGSVGGTPPRQIPQVERDPWGPGRLPDDGTTVAAGRATALALTWKKATSCSRACACAAISSAVEASSSAADALRCVTWSTRAMALLTWATPEDCSATRPRPPARGPRSCGSRARASPQDLARPLGHRHARGGERRRCPWPRTGSSRPACAPPSPPPRSRGRAPRPRRLDGRVQGEEVRLVGDLLDDRDLLGDGAHGARWSRRRPARLRRRRGRPSPPSAPSACRSPRSGLMDALICSRLDVVSCTEAACSLVPCERVCDDADTWLEAPLSAFAPARTSPITWASCSSMATKAWPKPSSSERGVTRDPQVAARPGSWPPTTSPGGRGTSR